MNKRHLKVTKDGHEKMKARIEVKLISKYSTFMATYLLFSVTKIFLPKQWNLKLFQSFLRGETQIPKDEAFKDCIEIYLAVFLRSERIAQSVSGGALSQHDCREVFR